MRKRDHGLNGDVIEKYKRERPLSVDEVKNLLNLGVEQAFYWGKASFFVVLKKKDDSEFMLEFLTSFDGRLGIVLYEKRK